MGACTIFVMWLLPWAGFGRDVIFVAWAAGLAFLVACVLTEISARASAEADVSTGVGDEDH